MSRDLYHSIVAAKGVSLALLLLTGILFWCAPVSAQVAAEPSTFWMEDLDLSKVLCTFSCALPQKTVGYTPPSH